MDAAMFHDDNGLNVRTYKPAQLNVVLLRVPLVMVPVHSSKTLTKKSTEDRR